MPTSLALINLGEADELAKRVGWNGGSNEGRGPTLLTGVGTAQVGAAAIRNGATWVQLTTAGGATAAILPADAELMQAYFVFVASGGTTGLVFPPSGAQINAAAGNASVSVVAQLPRIFYRHSALQWVSFLAA